MSGVVAVIDYGMGNLHSVASALAHAGAQQVLVTHDAGIIRQADRVVFPGVGAIRDCMAEIRRLKCDELLAEALADRHKPVLAICVGMQALMDHSEENDGVPCLGIVPGEVRYFGNPLVDAQGGRLKVPHMGWNQVRQQAPTGKPHPIWQGVPDESYFYFVHSFYAVPQNPAHCAGQADYGGVFAAAIARDNIFATQFHPEKSAEHGLALYRNFLHWNP